LQQSVLFCITSFFVPPSADSSAPLTPYAVDLTPQSYHCIPEREPLGSDTSSGQLRFASLDKPLLALSRSSRLRHDLKWPCRTPNTSLQQPDMAAPSLTFKEVYRNTHSSKPPASGGGSPQRDDVRVETNEPMRDADKARKLGGRLKFWTRFREGQKRYVRGKSDSISMRSTTSTCPKHQSFRREVSPRHGRRYAERNQTAA
jgi:hypothetical protein